MWRSTIIENNSGDTDLKLEFGQVDVGCSHASDVLHSVNVVKHNVLNDVFMLLTLVFQNVSADVCGHRGRFCWRLGNE